MADFKFKSSKVKFDIVNENDEQIKEYIIDVSNEEFVREIKNKGKETFEAIEATEKDDFDKAKQSMKYFIDLVLGKDEFDFLYEKFDRNIFAMMELTKALSEKINVNWSARMSAPYA